MTEKKEKSTIEKLTDVINEECNRGLLAETIIGCLETVKSRLMMAAEQERVRQKAKTLNEQNKNPKPLQQKPRGINT